ncbi:hypothetical protein [Paenibacillus sp. FSL R7-0333]|uniref:hypothetical protein n=1 Tax=Paenibacillus sp. FSL R7-0333 TaxID=1926587 RepID=UPI00096D1824|nr:hypothetical protein BK146_28370 [Paenibacillus sp. FSL R7-0333]
MSRLKLIQQYPLTDSRLSVHEIVGYILVVCKELRMENYHGEHLAAHTALRIADTNPEQAEEAYNHAEWISKKAPSVGELLRWGKAKSNMKGPISEKILEKIADDTDLDDLTVTEIQAFGYISIAATDLHFLKNQLTPLEMEFNYQLRILEPDAALAVGLRFLGLEMDEV